MVIMLSSQPPWKQVHRIKNYIILSVEIKEHRSHSETTVKGLVKNNIFVIELKKKYGVWHLICKSFMLTSKSFLLACSLFILDNMIAMQLICMLTCINLIMSICNMLTCNYITHLFLNLFIRKESLRIRCLACKCR